MGTKIMADKIGRGTSDTLTTDGNFVVGDSNTDTMTVNARVSSNLTPSDNNLYSLGIDTHQWNTAYINNLNLADSAGTDGQLLYNSGSGAIGATTNIYSNGTNIGLGTSNPTHALDIVTEVANGSRIRLQQNQGTNADGPDIKFERARGNTAAPTNLQSGDSIGRFEVFSYTSGTSNFTSSGNFGWVAANGDGTGDSLFRLQVRSKDGTGTSLMRTKIETDPATGAILFNGDVNPDLDNTYDLGSSTGPLTWANVYANNAQFGSITAATGGLSFSGSFDFSSATIGSFEVSDLTVMDGVIERTSNITGATGTVEHNCNNGHTFYHTSIVSNFTVNLTNLNLNTQGYATSVVLVLAQGGTGFIPSALEIGGSAQTIQWQGGSPPSGGSNTFDIVSFSIMNNAGVYLVLGQLIGFG